MISTSADVEKIKEALEILKPNGQLFEIRILQGKTTISGYFTSAETLTKELHKVSLKGANVFYTLNTIDDSCYSREQHDCFRQCKITTSDSDIVAYQWMLVDLDPVRKSGISSTDEELAEAMERGRRIALYLRERSFPAPVFACSGNGVHLLYPISLVNNEENRALIENCLKALAMLFSDEKVDIDTSVFNPSRISKLYGTMAQKGSSTDKRPHRMSKIISVPPNREVTKKEQLEQLAAELPKEEPKKIQKANKGFNIREWMQEHGIRVEKEKKWKDATKYILEECPFDGTHKAPDAVIIEHPNGAISFNCFHNSCTGHDWHEFRLKYEPDAYDDKRLEREERIEAGWKQWMAYNRNRQDIEYGNKTEEEPAKMFETAWDILRKPAEKRICIKTGLIDFDRKTGGLAKGEITLMSGVRASGKSSLLSQIGLNAINEENNVMVYSGELKDTRYMAWMFQQAAGPYAVKQHDKYEGFWYCRDDVKPKIADWLGDRFRLYNNEYGSNFKQIATSLNRLIKEFKSDLVIIDNMSILDLSDITDDRRADKWDQQKLFVETLKNLAMVCNCHIIFVAHPRKAAGFLRLDDVGGSGSLGNLVDNAMIVHRVNRDFLRGYKRDILGIPEGQKKRRDEEEEPGYDLGGDNCVEIVKERETGLQDLFIPLWYEKSTKRLKNDLYERVIYKWDNDGFLGQEDNPFEKGADDGN